MNLPFCLLKLLFWVSPHLINCSTQPTPIIEPLAFFALFLTLQEELIAKSQ